ncbi:MAG: GMC family oxidoreductase N-terminal domain-containing protein [Smithellaceae bacterium]|nr:GMC family oxidoreductase N-terminal domain-containing protein [Smithellaceae bacterium]
MKNGKSYEYIIIGTGPGGAPAARELAKAGKKVLMVEKGDYHKKLLGFPFGMRLLERFMILARSQEGVIIERGITVGGSSMVYQSNVMEPPKKLLDNMGIDFSIEAKELKKEIGVEVLPDRFYRNNKGLYRMLEAAEKMGIPFRAQEKFVHADKCKLGCDWCMLGCPENARWTAREHVEEAKSYGAELIYNAPVNKILFSAGGTKATGIQLKNGTVINADKIILSAGGIGSPALLLRSGIKRLGTQDVGTRFFMDPMNVMLGYSKEPDGGLWGIQTFTHAIESLSQSEGFMIGNCAAFGTWMVLSLFRMQTAIENLPKFPIMKRGLGLFLKLSDEAHGQIYPNEKTSKPFTAADDKRFKRGTDIMREIIIRSGGDPKTISVLKWAGGHPGGTLAMGRAINRDFSTEIDGLYVCDGSTMPVSPGAPPSLSICSMSVLLGKMLIGKVKAEDRYIRA